MQSMMIRFPSMMSNIQQTLHNGCVLSVDEKMIEIDVFLKKGELKIAVHFLFHQRLSHMKL
jgi:hypothetical protein